MQKKIQINTKDLHCTVDNSKKHHLHVSFWEQMTLAGDYDS